MKIGGIAGMNTITYPAHPHPTSVSDMFTSQQEAYYYISYYLHTKGKEHIVILYSRPLNLKPLPRLGLAHLQASMFLNSPPLHPFSVEGWLHGLGTSLPRNSTIVHAQF